MLEARRFCYLGVWPSSVEGFLIPPLSSVAPDADPPLPYFTPPFPRCRRQETGCERLSFPKKVLFFSL